LNWWQACLEAFAELQKLSPTEYSLVKSIGLSGQMHGAVLLDKNQQVLRPAILWNDGRCLEQCHTLEKRLPNLSEITGNLAMPGFTAPKLIWVAEHEPDIFAAVDKVLLPKDYIRFKLSNTFGSDMSDASGTLWLDVAKRAWSDECLAACGLTQQHMPELFEGSQASSSLSINTAQQINLPTSVVIAGGGGDNACAAVGIGAVADSQAFISLGTSGVYFVANDKYSPNPSRGVHAFCHALPDTWHQMGVILAATDSLNWLSKVFDTSPAKLTQALEGSDATPTSVLYLPYLGGERTPHNDANARGVFTGIDHNTDATAMTKAVMQGVGFAFRDCQNALAIAGTSLDAAYAIGGGSQSQYWLQLIASALKLPLHITVDGDFGAGLGAARLGMIAAESANAIDVCQPPEVEKTIEPNESLYDDFSVQFERFEKTYVALRTI